MIWRVPIKNLVCIHVRKKITSAINLSFLKMPFYAVAKGRAAGIFMTWPDCEAQVKGFPGARYKKFDTVVEAQDFVNTQGGSNKATQAKKFNVKSNFNNTSINKSSTSQGYKRYSTSTSNKEKDVEVPKKKTRKSKSNRKSYSDHDSNESDDSDDLNTILCKQMDDIEDRLKGFEKGVDKIIKKSTKSSGRKAIMIEPRGNQSVDLAQDHDGYVQVYTDGACSGNGKNGAKAGLGVYWGDNHPWNKSEPVSGRATNNCGEIQAATCAIKTAIQNGVTKLSINTDSKFLINSVTKWIPGWKRKGWKLQSGEPVKNEIDFKELDLLQNQLQIKWNYVEAHQGIYGNEMADQLARAGAAMYNK